VLKGDVSLVKEVDSIRPLKPPTDRSMPSAPATMTVMRRRSPLAGIVAALAAGVVLVGAVIGWKLRPAPSAELSVSSGVPGATVCVDGKAIGPAPIKLSGLSPGDHEVVLETAEAKTLPRHISLEAGQSLVLDLAPAVPEPPKPPVAAQPTEPAPAPAPPTPPAPKPEAHRPAAAAAKGRLTLETTPWTSVYFGGKPLGQTPLIETVLPAGHNQLKLVNEEKSITRVIEVDVAPGQTTVMRLTL
jgi:pyruvate/2-oxoglutarate dehydrogenase complex dihydrolipoamide acyltransferase (E2) component